jgi:Transglutaminase-like superfamily
MFRTSSAFATGELQHDGEASLRWVRGTQHLDVMSTKLRTRVFSLTQLLPTDQAKAVAVHDFVKGIPFGCVANYSSLTASDVIKLGHGDCFTKGMLFVAMLRSIRIPARLRFMSLPVQFLRGVIESEEATIMHAAAEVYLNKQWWMTDTYVPDALMQEAARRKLLTEDKKLGYGIHVAGKVYWDGASHALAQCSSADVSSLPVVDWGVADDPVSFYAEESHSELRRNFASRLKWRLAAPLVNKRVAALRSSMPQGQ